MTHDVGRAVAAPHLEIAMIGGQPAVKDLDDFDRASIEQEAARRLLAAMPRVTLDPNAYIRTMHVSPASPRLLCDEMLHGLARWLRAAGYDTGIAGHGLADRTVFDLAIREARILLTCDREFLSRRDAERRVVMLPACGLDACVRELRTRLDIDWLRAPFTRCLIDNTPLVAADREARNTLPPKAQRLPGPVRTCPECARMYWPGSHVRRMRARLTAWQGIVHSHPRTETEARDGVQLDQHGFPGR